MKLTKADIDKVRHIEGFPIAKDEDIIALSNPPFYTSCPNPFIEDFIKEYGTPYNESTDEYHREPFAADVSEGKGDPVYNAHSYHTKVPYKAIMRYILHYTEPGDIVFDGFCGTGMTGVAAQMCGNPDNGTKYIINKDIPNAIWGNRIAILNDLAPAASFIAMNYNISKNSENLEAEANRITNICKNELGWVYETNHVNEYGVDVLGLNQEPIKGIIKNIVWSDVFICPNCGTEIIYWDVVVDEENEKMTSVFKCPSCTITLKKSDCENARQLSFDSNLNCDIEMIKQVPVYIYYSVGGKSYKKKADEVDLRKIEDISNLKNQYWYPTDRMCEGGESRRNDKYGITHVHHFFTPRNNLMLSLLHHEIIKSEMRDELLYVFTACIQRANKTNRFRFKGTGGLSGTLYIPSLIFERNVLLLFKNKLRDILKQKRMLPNKEFCITQNSLTDIENIISNSIDYIFTDPPFGSNLNYAELSFIWEAWLKVKTNSSVEAIINRTLGKGLLEYQELMTKCFIECYRVLKPNRWMTVEFHNSQNSVWNAIQESLNRAGFIIADVRTLDKKQGSFKQVTTTSATKQDLIISAYKPKDSFRKTILEHAGTEETAWDFVREHLDKLPVVVQKGDKIEHVREREAFLLFDRMVAYHVMAGIAVPLDASEFYKGLDTKFLKRDNMYFLHDQINKYDDARIKSDIEPIQFSFYVCDERSAIGWLYQQLNEENDGPQTYGELQPKFVQELRQDKHEDLPELMTMLEENFLQDEDGKWYIPDITKEGDLIKLREKRLLKDFEEYLTGKGKLKTFRTEAVRAGFAKLWKEKNYEDIVRVAERLPEKVIQEDDKLLMYYDISLSRME